jgi:hypothetical protein
VYVTTFGLDGRGSTPGRRKRFFSSPQCSTPALGALSPEVKRPGREADYLTPDSVEVKNGGAVPPFPIRLHGVVHNRIHA